MKISLNSILLHLEVLPFYHLFGNVPKESRCLHKRVLEGQRESPTFELELEAPQCTAALATQVPVLLSESLCADPEAKSRVSVLETALQPLGSSSPLPPLNEHRQ